MGTATPIKGTEALEAYLESGGNFIDTAVTYGESERTIGAVLKDLGLGNYVYIATKTKSGEPAETVPQIRKDLETSLKNLGRDYVDILYLHMPPEDDDVIDMALNECEALKREGKIRGIGASVKGPAVTDATVSLCRKYIDTGGLTSFSSYTAFYASGIFPQYGTPRRKGSESSSARRLKAGF